MRHTVPMVDPLGPVLQQHLAQLRRDVRGALVAMLHRIRGCLTQISAVEWIYCV